ncbi:MAG: metal-dependent transcriptional regulator [Ignavibacteria bacterium]|nr:metal-dependent transcriptional regulator [Ignavibacteria bacterium]
MRTAVEDYIKYIYTLQASGIKVSTGNLAGLMQISMPSVSEMIKKLTDAGYISNKPYHGFKLSPGGEKIALMQLRKHRLLEYFMINVLNFEWEDVHQEADKIEHAVSEKFINSLEYFLGYPKYDPHGHPIPDIKGKIAALKSMPVTKAKVGEFYYVSSVDDKSNEILKYLKEIGVRINSKIKISKVMAFDGSVIIILKGKKYLLSRKIAERLFVSGIDRNSEI